ncbi:ketopantoate reductase family protein [Halomarina oriensis]|uniref:2-dehydropantoate 2-reductase n=1 Tax=Halomarina oriensis TaxID=671145 RepID=A0A6B0GL17_9EURY|nr:2-dehydropantoate 2-reductase [Halomarina oriensis]MWG34427.1 2-dehydropantoate 2-reductase [Halomarina oriensis]
MDVVVVGAGSLGSLLGGLLARAHDVTLVGRAPHVERVRERGLRVTGTVETTVFPDARTAVPASADLALVTVKAYDTGAAAAALAETALDAVCSLQNGLGNERTLADALDAAVLAGTCTYGARLVAPGEVACTGVGEVVLGAREGGPSETADRVGRAFADADLVTSVAEDMPRRLWEKLAVNAGINAPTALARIHNGALLDDEAGTVMRTATREVAAAARSEGFDLSDDTAVRAVESVASATADNRSSMLQDVEKSRRTEVDSINGVVAGPDAPVNSTLTALLRAWEREQGLRE